MLWIKALHIVFVISWFAGLFYLPRILVNLALENDGNAAAHARLLTMARKLYRFMTPLAVFALLESGCREWWGCLQQCRLETSWCAPVEANLSPDRRSGCKRG